MTEPVLRLQDLPPRWAHFCLGVERFIHNELDLRLQGAQLAVALSGGVDSTALLLVLHCLAPRMQCRLLAVHCDHGIRPESAKDAHFSAQLCARLGVACHSERMDVPALARERKMGLEEAGRLARQKLYARMRSERDCSHIATGHQLNDLAEDQLMRQLRGAGWPALGGMRGVAPEQGVLRPLLLTPKSVLEKFVAALGFSWREDASNQDTIFLRNRVRHSVLPLLLQENPAYLDAVAGLWRQAQYDAAYWEATMEHMLSELEWRDNGALFLPHPVLSRSPKALRLRLFKKCLEMIGPGQPLATSIFRLERSWQERAFGAALQFPGDKEARVTARGVLFLLRQRNH